MIKSLTISLVVLSLLGFGASGAWADEDTALKGKAENNSFVRLPRPGALQPRSDDSASGGNQFGLKAERQAPIPSAVVEQDFMNGGPRFPDLDNRSEDDQRMQAEARHDNLFPEDEMFKDKPLFARNMDLPAPPSDHTDYVASERAYAAMAMQQQAPTPQFAGRAGIGVGRGLIGFGRVVAPSAVVDT
jgi:hypothetical protein